MINIPRKFKELYIVIIGFIFMSVIITNILLYWAFGTEVSGEVLKFSHYSYNAKGGIIGYHYTISVQGKEYLQYFPDLPPLKIKLLKHPIFNESFTWVDYPTTNLLTVYFSYFGSEFAGGIFLLMYIIIIAVLIDSIKNNS